MRRISSGLLLLLSACANQPSSTQSGTLPGSIVDIPSAFTPSLGHARAALLDWNTKNHSDSPLVRIEVVPVDPVRGWFAATYDWDERWWGGACFLQIRPGMEASVIELKNLGENCMISIRVPRPRGIAGPLVEILGMTHMGNGNLYLFEVEDAHPRLIFETRAVDSNEGWEVLENGVLDRQYADLNADGVDDLLLTGTALLREQLRQVDDEGILYYTEGPKWAGRELVRKAFVFIPAKHGYEELKSWRLGPSWYHD